MSATSSLNLVANSVASVAMGELVGGLASEVTKRVRIHRAELGAGNMGAGSGTSDSLLDILLDTLAETGILIMGISFTQKAMPSLSSDLPCLILFIVGIANQCTLPINLRKLTSMLLKDKDTLASEVDAQATTASSN